MDAAVVTGQQLGLFGGPCFTVYKAWTAIVWARTLSRRWGRRVRPVFWLQTEDHDFPEIGWCGGPDGARVALSSPSPPSRHVDLPEGEGASGRASISERRVPAEIDRLVEGFAEAVGPSPHRDAVIERLATCWAPGRVWTDAFVALLGWVFEGTDLLFFDPRHPEVAAAAAPVHERALFQAPALCEALRRRASEIEAAGFRVQVPVRAETLSFVHCEGPDRDRQRLRWAGTRAVAPDGHAVDEATLLRWLSEEPRRFTSSALLRPIVQDSLLPTAAYVAGPGEAAYWAQLPPLYAAWELPMPKLLPRARVRLLEPWTRRLLERHGLRPDDVRDVDALLDRMGVGAQGAPTEAVAVELAEARRALGATLRARSGKLDVSGPLGALDRKIERSFGRFLQKYDRLRKRSDADGLAAARRLTASLMPQGVPQERFAGFMGYVARHGRDHFMTRLEQSWSPGDVEVVDVAL